MRSKQAGIVTIFEKRRRFGGHRSVFDAASLRLFLLGIRAIFTTNARFFSYCLSGRFVYRFHSPVFRPFFGGKQKTYNQVG